jgi:hypothetical protein
MVDRLRNTKTQILLLVALLLTSQNGRSIELTEPEGAAHGYPGWMETNGKKLANGEFRQWIQNERLHIVITYNFPDGQLYEEDALFRQEPELAQEQWSWRESKGKKVQRQFAADFIAKTASVEIHTDKENRTVSDKIEIEPGRTFAGFGFTIALANLRQRLTKGEQVELKAVGFTPVPTLKPQLVTVQVSYGGIDRMKMAGRFYNGYRFIVHPEIPAIAKLFIQVPDTKIWLTSPPPAGFLRWEGPIILPTDPIRRVDLISDSASGAAEPVGKK